MLSQGKTFKGNSRGCRGTMPQGLPGHPSASYCLSPPDFPAVRCLQPPNITNGRLKGNASATFPSGAAVSYSCDPGYSLVGNAFINCTGSGAWSQPLPQCKGEAVLPLVFGIPCGTEALSRFCSHKERNYPAE